MGEPVELEGFQFLPFCRVIITDPGKPVGISGGDKNPSGCFDFSLIEENISFSIQRSFLFPIQILDWRISAFYESNAFKSVKIIQNFRIQVIP